VRSYLLPITILAFFLSTPATAQEWAKKMFTTTSHDFGTVARGSKSEFRFQFKNIYNEDVHVASVRSSCGCTTPTVEKRDLKTYETSDIIAKFNTDTFTGYRSATVTVTFDKPYYAEVQLHVQGNIRSDILVQPPSVEIGNVQQGKEVEKKITVIRNSRSDWKITDVRCANEQYEVEVVERSRNGSQVIYDLNVRLLATAPPGYLNDQLLLETNDPNARLFPIAVEGRVEPDISISRLLNFGTITAGESKVQTLAISSKNPFKITRIYCEDPRFSFKVPLADAAPKSRYFVPVTFVADQSTGRVQGKIIVETDRGSKLPAVPVQATIQPTEEESAPDDTKITQPELGEPRKTARSEDGVLSETSEPPVDPVILPPEARTPVSEVIRPQASFRNENILRRRSR